MHLCQAIMRRKAEMLDMKWELAVRGDGKSGQWQLRQWDGPANRESLNKFG